MRRIFDILRAKIAQLRWAILVIMRYLRVFCCLAPFLCTLVQSLQMLLIVKFIALKGVGGQLKRMVSKKHS